MDREAGIFADQANVHRIEHVGRFFESRGPLNPTSSLRATGGCSDSCERPWPIKIFALGRFEVLRNDQPLRFSRKVQRKPLALLKALITLGGREVREDVLMDTLWPDAEGDAARVALTSALHRLRGLLDCDGAVVRQEGQLSLDDRFCWVDVWAVERCAGTCGSSGGWQGRYPEGGRPLPPRLHRWRSTRAPSAPTAPPDRSDRAAVRALRFAGGFRLVRGRPPRGSVCRGPVPESHDRLPPAWPPRRGRGSVPALPDRPGWSIWQDASAGDRRTLQSTPLIRSAGGPSWAAHL